MIPPLPDADYVLAFPDRPYDRGYVTNEDGYTADQLRSYGEACAMAERERCAKLCDDKARSVLNDLRPDSWSDEFHLLAAVIRSGKP